MNFVATSKAPAAIGPYSQAVSLHDFLFCSGQLPLDPKTMKLVGTDIITQARQALANLGAVLDGAGLNYWNVIKTTVFLKNMQDFPGMNKAYAEVFGDHKPARSTIEVARLPMDALVEIECIAIG